jgi:hypothetical protein
VSTPAVRKITLDPEALAALEADTEVKFDKPLSGRAVNIIRRGMARAVFGPTMMPRFRQRCLSESSYVAIKACWAADWWQLKMTEKYG